MAAPSVLSAKRIALAATGLLMGLAGLEVATTTSCAATPVNAPIHSFETAKFIDVVCMQTLSAEDAGGIPAIPKSQGNCTPVPPGVTGSILPNHLFALVTQTVKAEVAVVDLTAGIIIDEDLSTPGTNFLPVGKLPSGIASSLDGEMTYVASADLDKPAIYALPSTQILGNSQQLEGGKSPTPPLLTTWPVCALPQTPGPITIIPSPPPVPGDAGADGGDAGTASGSYVLAVVLTPNTSSQLARVVTIDPLPLLRGGGVIPTLPGDEVIPPGSLKPCRILGELPLAGEVPDVGPGPRWDDGIKYIDAAIDAPVPSSATCNSSVDAGVEAGTPPPSLPNPAPQAASVARAGQYLYVSDLALPIIHVFDLSTPTRPRELAPLRATSISQPNRQVTLGAIAVSPPTRDYQRFLYAVDVSDSPSASIIAYDITDPVASPHEPLRRPHADLNPLTPEDRITFQGPVVSVAFVQHDWPLALTTSGLNVAGAAYTGLLCNPNPNVGNPPADASVDAEHFTDPGANYRNSSVPFADEPLGPMRLRGIFAFATLSSGQVMTIDVDDWDAPCRRPVSMTGYTNAIAPPEPPSPRGDGGALDPYEAPETGTTNGATWVSEEVFFPVSAPHRARSEFPLRNDPTLGLHYPNVVLTPQLFAPGPDGGIGAAITGSISSGNPALLPTQTNLPDPSTADGGFAEGGAGIRIAWEDPTAHVDQNWNVDYEGKLQSFAAAPIAFDIDLVGEGIDQNRPHYQYQSLFLSSPGGSVCAKGVEDFTIGQQRAAQVNAEILAKFCPGQDAGGCAALPERLDQWLGDYVQVADDLLPQSDPYWSSDPGANQTDDCWDDFTNATTGDAGVTLTDPTQRYNTCQNIFGYASDELVSRDFPILAAFDDGLVITRFNYPSNAKYPVPATTSNRQVTPPDPTNVQALKQLKCCFHGQMTFNVRTGGEWVTTGTQSGYLHHMTVDSATNRCVTSCDPELVLLSSRLVGIPPTRSPFSAEGYVPDRDSPLAVRNPMFAFFMQHPWVPDPNISSSQPIDAGGPPLVVQRPPRDSLWQFGLKGELAPLSLNLASTNSNVSPQSMLFIPSLGQLAIVDGAQEGLILIDLNTVTITGNTYY